MTSTLPSKKAGSETKVQPPRAIRHILLATDGTTESDAAFTLASNLAKRSGASLAVISVCDALIESHELPPFTTPLTLLEDPAGTQARRIELVHLQCKRILGSPGTVPVTVVLGSVGTEIADHARKISADIIITGRGRHGVVDRLLGEEHLIRLLRSVHCPVFAVEGQVPVPPRCIVVAVDLSEHDAATLSAAAALASEETHVYLAHVKAERPFDLPPEGSWRTDYEESVRNHLEQLKAQSSFPDMRNVQAIVLAGHPGLELTEFSKRVNADLIAAGVHGAGFIHRLVIGSVTTYLVRAAPCSILAVRAPAAIM